jgi:hypothetical protein
LVGLSLAVYSPFQHDWAIFFLDDSISMTKLLEQNEAKPTKCNILEKKPLSQKTLFFNQLMVA